MVERPPGADPGDHQGQGARPFLVFKGPQVLNRVHLNSRQICLINNLTIIVAWTFVPVSSPLSHLSLPLLLVSQTHPSLPPSLPPPSPEEAGLYLATYKIYEHKPPDSLKGRVDNDYRSILNRALTGIKGVNKTDCLTLSTNFGVS